MSKSVFYIVASLAGLYIADVELNHGRAVDTLGLYNWNKPVNQIQEKANYFTNNIENSFQNGKDSIKDTINKVPNGEDFKDKAIDLYNAAYSKLIVAQSQANEESDEHLKEAKQHFESARHHLSQFGKDAIEQAQEKYKNAGNKLYGKFSDIAFSAQDQWAHLSHFFVDKYHELYDDTGNMVVDSQEKAQEIADYYDEEAKKAKKAYEETQSSLLQWRESKSKEIQEKAKANYDHILAKSEKAHAELHKWIDAVKEDSTSEAKKAYHYAAGVKDRAHQAAYDAKENVKDKVNEHAHQAHNYAAGVKEDANQVILDVNENAKNNAEVAKDYIIGTASNAIAYLKDKYSDLRDSLGRLTVNSHEKAQEVADYYDEQLKKAKSEYDQTQASWLYWRKAKSIEIQNQAKKNYETLLEKDQEAKAELQRWIDKTK